MTLGTLSNITWYMQIREYNVPDGTSSSAANSYMEDFFSGTEFIVPVRIPNQTLSVQAFINIIQAAFDEAQEFGYTQRHYYIDATLNYAEGNLASPTMHNTQQGDGWGNTQAMNILSLARMNGEIAIRYSIWSQDVDGERQEFRLLWKTGPYGSLNSNMATTSGLDHEEASISIINHPSLKVIEVPFRTLTTTVVDSPPLPPEVEIIPRKSINNEMMFLLNGSTGRLHAEPIMIEDADKQWIINEFNARLNNENYLVAQGVVQLTEAEKLEVALKSKFLFTNDDPVGRFEIYRTEKPPSSYKDFREMRRDIVEEEVAPGKRASAQTYIDRLTPNVKYWYCFRSYDIHNNRSNPTSVFEIEIVDNNGQIFPVIKEYHFPTEVKQSFTKPGRRFLYIAPSFKQTMYSQETPYPSDVNLDVVPNTTPILGAAESSVWERKFKIRVSSTKTGKKFDLNIIFKNTGVINP